MRHTSITLSDEIDSQISTIRFSGRFPSLTSAINYVLREGLDAIARAAVEGSKPAEARR